MNFTITSRISHLCIGIYEGETAADAIVAMHADAGLRSAVVDGEVVLDPRDIESGAVDADAVEELLVEEAVYAGADITVRTGRDVIDPQGLGSDEENESCEEYILDCVRDAFPGATVRAVRSGGRQGGRLADGTDIDDEVDHAVAAAWEAWLY